MTDFEINRVFSLPHRNWTDKSSRKVAELLTKKFKRPSGSLHLKPLQGASLYELSREGNLICLGRVGIGKSLIAFLAGSVLRSPKIVFLLPSNLIEKTERDYAFFNRHFYLPRNIFYQSFEMLSRASMKNFLELTRPSLLIFDEAHNLKNPRAAVAKRVSRYLENCKKDKLNSEKDPSFQRKYPDCNVVILTGSFYTRSLREAAHIFNWVYSDSSKMPIPQMDENLTAWCKLLDAKARKKTEFISSLFEPYFDEQEKLWLLEGHRSKAARSCFGRRLVSTPGIVSAGDPFESCELELKKHFLTPSKKIQACLIRLREEGRLPDGTLVPDKRVAAQFLRELALGFFYIWSPPPPDEWLEARKNWVKFVRKFLSHKNCPLDTEEQVKDAVEKGLIRTKTLAPWLRVKSSYTIKTSPIWIDSFVLQFCRTWASKNSGIIWVAHKAFGEKLSDITGLPFFHEKGLSNDGSFIEDHPGEKSLIASIYANREGRNSLIASIYANREGRNLQKWSKNLVIDPPSRGDWWEQLIGRTHREYQKSSVVYFEVVFTCVENQKHFEKALEDAENIEKSLQQAQKLLQIKGI